jgi:hypothetical protein
MEYPYPYYYHKGRLRFNTRMPGAAWDLKFRRMNRRNNAILT